MTGAEEIGSREAGEEKREEGRGYRRASLLWCSSDESHTGRSNYHPVLAPLEDPTPSVLSAPSQSLSLARAGVAFLSPARFLPNTRPAPSWFLSWSLARG